jgi:hypothetical protein
LAVWWTRSVCSREIYFDCFSLQAR